MVGIAFAFVVLSFIKLEHLFIPWYFSVAFTGFICALIVPKLPPLRNIPKHYYCKNHNKKTAVQTNKLPQEGGINQALSLALQRADSAPTIFKQAKQAILTATDVTLTVFPTLMIVGVTGLALIEFTPVFSFISLPLIPYLELLGLPEAPAAAVAIMSGLVDMLMPAVLGANIESELTRFVVAGIAINGIIFLSEVAVILIRAQIGLTIFHLLAIWLLRVLIGLPILTLLGHWVLS